MNFNRVFHYKPSILGYHYFWIYIYMYPSIIQSIYGMIWIPLGHLCESMGIICWRRSKNQPLGPVNRRQVAEFDLWYVVGSLRWEGYSLHQRFSSIKNPRQKSLLDILQLICPPRIFVGKDSECLFYKINRSTNGKLLVWGPVVWDSTGVALTFPFIT